MHTQSRLAQVKTYDMYSNIHTYLSLLKQEVDHLEIDDTKIRYWKYFNTDYAHQAFVYGRYQPRNQEYKQVIIQLYIYHDINPILNIYKYINTYKSTPLTRVPELFTCIELLDKNAVAALIYESVPEPTEAKLILSKGPYTAKSLQTWIAYLHDYRQQRAHIQQSIPPESKPSSEEYLAKIRQKLKQGNFSSQQQAPSSEDHRSVEQALLLLTKYLNTHQLEFCHAHLSRYDLIKQNDHETQCLIAHPDYWRWELPLRDLCFAYQWSLIEVSQAENSTIQTLQDQQTVWLQALEEIDDVRRLESEQKAFTYARLERAVFALMVDRSLVNNDGSQPNNEKNLLTFLRNDLQQLIQQLQTDI